MRLIRKENSKPVSESDLYNFIHNAFKEGAVPNDLNTFRKCFNDNTTDGSLCFAYDFGTGKDDTAMLFFYPYFCAVPQRYHKNLRNQDYCNINMLVLDYQFELAKIVADVDYLHELKQQAGIRYTNSMAFMQYDVYKRSHRPSEEDFSEEDFDNFSLKDINLSIDVFKTRFKGLMNFIDERISQLTLNYNIEEQNDTNEFDEDEKDSE